MKNLYRKFADALEHGQPLFLLLIRVYIGYQCIVSGWAHLHHIDKTADYFASLHIPMPKANVIISASAELVGGGLLLLGLFSRITALVLTGNFLVAVLTAQLSNNNFSYSQLGHQIWNDQTNLLNDTAFPFLVTAIIILFFGPGLLSLDAAFNIGNARKKK